MVDITASGKLCDQLNAAKSLAAIRDSRGQLLGYFVPVSPHEDELYALALEQADSEELARRARDTSPRHTTQEVLERLHQLGSSGCASQ
ncbi:MAG: hypothetical protein AB7I48_01565 [Planctomycetaceae bacterium]